MSYQLQKAHPQDVPVIFEMIDIRKRSVDERKRHYSMAGYTLS